MDLKLIREQDKIPLWGIESKSKLRVAKVASHIVAYITESVIVNC